MADGLFTVLFLLTDGLAYVPEIQKRRPICVSQLLDAASSSGLHMCKRKLPIGLANHRGHPFGFNETHDSEFIIQSKRTLLKKSHETIPSLTAPLLRDGFVVKKRK